MRGMSTSGLRLSTLTTCECSREIATAHISHTSPGFCAFAGLTNLLSALSVDALTKPLQAERFSRRFHFPAAVSDPDAARCRRASARQIGSLIESGALHDEVLSCASCDERYNLRQDSAVRAVPIRMRFSE